MCCNYAHLDQVIADDELDSDEEEARRGVCFSLRASVLKYQIETREIDVVVGQDNGGGDCVEETEVEDMFVFTFSVIDARPTPERKYCVLVCVCVCVCVCVRACMIVCVRMAC